MANERATGLSRLVCVLICLTAGLFCLFACSSPGGSDSGGSDGGGSDGGGSDSGGNDGGGGGLPAVPRAPTVTASAQAITLVWGAVPGATHYALVWTNDGSDPGPASSRIDGISVTQHTHTGLDYTKTYSYRLCACNDAGDSALSGPVSATPLAPPLAAPTGLSVVASSSSASVDWDDHPVSGVVYRLARRASYQSTPSTIADNLTVSSYTDNTISEGVRYSYKVMALQPQEQRQSPYCGEVSGFSVKTVAESERNNPDSWAFSGIWGGYSDDATSLDEFVLTGSYSGLSAIYQPALDRNIDYDLFKITLKRDETLVFSLLQGNMSGLFGMSVTVMEVYKRATGSSAETAVRTIYLTSDSYVYRPWDPVTMQYVYLQFNMPEDLINTGAYSYRARISIIRR